MKHHFSLFLSSKSLSPSFQITGLVAADGRQRAPDDARLELAVVLAQLRAQPRLGAGIGADEGGVIVDHGLPATIGTMARIVGPHDLLVAVRDDRHLVRAEA